MKKRVTNTGYEVQLKNTQGQAIDFNDEIEQIVYERYKECTINGCSVDFGQDFQQAQEFVEYLESQGYLADLMLIVVYDKPDFTGNNIKLFKIA
tara:strand:+ start:1330 stop:1611 length:282 start_codon:yes stop_codon:yes gene_type:complete